MTTIDLGDLTATPEPPRPPRSRPVIVRDVALALVALLCLTAVTASARPAPPRGVRVLWQTPFGESDLNVLGQDSLYLARNIGGQFRLSAFDLATGRLRWERATGEGSYMQLAESAGLLLLRVAPAVDGFSGDTVAVDTRTGKDLWRMTGEPQDVYGDTAVLADYSGGQMRGLRVVRLSDQVTLWSRSVPGSDGQTVVLDNGRPVSLVTLRRGKLDVYRYADGTLTASAWVPVAVDVQGNPQFNDLSTTRDYLVVNSSLTRGSDATVYRLDTLARVWGASSDTGLVFACTDSLVCVDTVNGLSADDPATGRQVWFAADATSAWRIGDRLALADGATDGSRWLLGLDGRRIGQRVTGTWAVDLDPHGSLLLTHTTRNPPSLSAVSRWDLATGRIDLAGALPGPVRGCDAVTHYLTCMHGENLEIAYVSGG